MRLPSFALLLLLLVGLVGCDHATKLWAETRLDRAEAVSIVPAVLDLRYTKNYDVGFNLLRFVPSETRRPLVIALGVVVMAAVVATWVRRRPRRTVETLGYALVVAGAAGNVIDRLVRGYVVDFIHLHHWPVFNVADVCIVAGVALLLVRWNGARASPSSTPT